MTVKWRVRAGISAGLIWGAAVSTAQATDLSEACRTDTAPGAARVAGDRPDIDALIAAGEAFLAAYPKSAYDPLEAAIGTEMTPDAIRDWVATKTTLRAYRGALRGWRGVLSDRQGNSLDRALLLAEMLKFAGYDARLARAELSADEAATLVGELGKPASVPVPDLPADGPLARFALSGDELRLTVDEVECGLAIENRIDEQARLLAALVGGFQDAMGPIGALADHWWVQVNDAGAWRDLDPSGVGAAPTWTGAAEALPADQVHRVTVRVMAETVRRGRAEKTELVAMARPASAFTGATLALRMEPAGLGEIDWSDLDGWTARARQAREWVAILTHGEEAKTGKSVSLTGRVRAAAATLSGEARKQGQTGGGMLGGLGGGTTRSNKDADGALMAIWIDYRIDRPGAPAQTARRYLFDLRGAAARADGDTFDASLDQDQIAARERGLLNATDILITAGDPSPVDLPRQRTEEALAIYKVVKVIFEAMASGDRTAVMEAVRNLPVASPLLLYGFAELRGASGVEGWPALHDQPNIFAMHRRPGTRPGTVRVWIDIVRSDAATELGPTAVLRQGVIDTVLEAALLDGPTTAPANASEVMAKGQAAGIGWEAARTIGDLARYDLPPDTLAMMRRAVEDGAVVVAPLGPVRPDRAVAWWRVDPLTGATLGIGANGYGASTFEYVQSVASIAIKVSSVFGCSKKLVDYEMAGKADGMAAAKIGVCFVNAAVGGYVPYAKFHKLNKIRRLNLKSRIRGEMFTRYKELASRVAKGGKTGIGSFTKSEKALYDLFTAKGTFKLPADDFFLWLFARFTDGIAAFFMYSTFSVSGR